MTCDNAADTLVIEAESGLLRHNRQGLDSGAETPFDLNFLFPGVQTASASGAATLIVQMGGGSDSVTVGTPTSPAELSTRRLQFDLGSNAGDTLTIDNSSSTVGRTIDFGNANATTGGTTFNIGFGQTALGGVRLLSGSGDDNIRVTGSAATVPLEVQAGPGNDQVLLGDPRPAPFNSLNAFAATGTVTVDGGTSTTGDTLTVGDVSAGTTATDGGTAYTYTVTSTSFDGAASRRSRTAGSRRSS